MLKDFGLVEEQIKILVSFIQCNTKEEILKGFPKIKDCEGYKELEQTISMLNDLGYMEYVKFQPNVVRGLDYYTGMVFEVFDTNPKNTRSLFGGGRYDGLAGIFGSESFPAVGCAPGDEMTKLFLEEWNLFDRIREEVKIDTYYFPILSEELKIDTFKTIRDLRRKGLRVVGGLEIQTVGKALRYSNQRGFDKVILFGTEEKKEKSLTIKDLKTGEQERKKLKEV